MWVAQSTGAAIQDKVAVTISYQSMTSVDASSRTISPHALGFDGFRWHVPAYCHKRGRFSDFVLARMLKLAARMVPEAMLLEFVQMASAP